MAKFETVEPGTIALIQQTADGRILQIGLTTEQSNQLQIYLAIISKNNPLVQMGEEHDLVLKSSLTSESK